MGRHRRPREGSPGRKSGPQRAGLLLLLLKAGYWFRDLLWP